MFERPDPLAVRRRETSELIDLPPVGPWRSEVPAWRTFNVNGGVFCERRLESMSGPAVFLVVTGIIVVLGLSVLWRGDPSTTAAGFWPPAGAALVAMIVLPVRRWGWVLMAIVVPSAIGVAFGVVPIVPALWWALGNCLEPALAAAVLRRCRTAPWLTRGRLMLLFLGCAVIAAPLIGAAIGSVGTVIGYGRPWLRVWVEWVIGDGLGVLVVVPLLVTYTTRRDSSRTRRESSALAVCVACAIGLAFVDIGSSSEALLPYVILALMVWAGMRFGTRAAAAAGFLVAEAANLASSVGLGPFTAATTGQGSPIRLHIFLAIALVLSFVVAAMASDLADVDEVNRVLTHRATHDALTGLPNRVLLSERLQHALEAHRSTGVTLAVLLIDLDDFKKVNDRYGHPCGDDVLTVVAQLLRAGVRSQDLLARLDGDEFVLVCESLDGWPAARELADHVLSCIGGPIVVDGHEHRLTASIGVALVEQGHDELTAIDVLRRADIALHLSKRIPEVTVSLFDDEMETRVRRRSALEEELSRAVERDELRVHYQPIVSLTTGRVERFEALLRWTNARFGVVGPDEFIPIAESAGLIVALGDWVLETACRDVAGWHLTSPTDRLVRVAVNVSARQLCDLTFPARVDRTLARTGLCADALILEITETALMDDLDVSSGVLMQLRAAGIRIAMDDFGTGYSSMTYLRQFPVDLLKIDRSFVAGLGVVPEDTAIVSSIIGLAHSFGLDVIAEGVETVAQMSYLGRLGCDHGQGYLWSPAVDAAAALVIAGHIFDVHPRMAVMAQTA